MQENHVKEVNFIGVNQLTLQLKATALFGQKTSLAYTWKHFQGEFDRLELMIWNLRITFFSQ